MKENTFLAVTFLWFVYIGGFAFLWAKETNEIPEQIIFKACLDKSEILNDESICDCATFVGHPNWCNGDVKY